MKQVVVTFLSLGLLLSGCKQPIPQSPHVTLVEGEDAEINEAISKARQTLPEFLKALQTPNPNQHDFAVKVEFKYSEGSELMWIVAPIWDGKTLSGTLSQEPHWAKSVNKGDTIHIVGDKISDWMFVENEKLIGGYTIRVLRSRMSPEERAELESSSGFKL